MADYNIYAIERLDTDEPEFIYVGMTERNYSKRFDEHRRAVGGVYKRKCKGGKKGDVRNPNTPYGLEANKPLYHFIRDELGGEDGEGELWRLESLPGDNNMTENAYIDLALSWGWRLFNMVDGQGEFITERNYKDVDLTDCDTAEEAVGCITEWELEQKRQEQEAKAEALALKKEVYAAKLPAMERAQESELWKREDSLVICKKKYKSLMDNYKKLITKYSLGRNDVAMEELTETTIDTVWETVETKIHFCENRFGDWLTMMGLGFEYHDVHWVGNSNDLTRKIKELWKDYFFLAKMLNVYYNGDDVWQGKELDYTKPRRK